MRASATSGVEAETRPGPRAVSAPSSGADLRPTGRRARGCRRRPVPGATGRVGPARPAHTAAMDTSRSQRPPAASASRQAPAAVSPVSGSATASAQNIGSPSCQTTSPPAAAASSPKATRLAASPAARSPVMETHTCGPPPRTTSAASIPSCASARGRLASITTSARRTSARRSRTPSRALQVEGDGPLAPVQEVEEGAAARAAAPSGRCVDSTLTTGGAGTGQQVAAERARPQGGEVDDEQARRSCRAGRDRRARSRRHRR